MHILNQQIKFPPVTQADEDGLLAIGGDLSYDRLLAAYQNGIFPWYEGEVILWWSPDPRFVLFPHELRISKSMRPLLNSNKYEFTINKAFAQVIKNCKKITRKDQDGTWITPEMETAYKNLHQQGIAISAETWEDGVLIGGLYGILMGKAFCGESMFSAKPNASKFCFIKLIEYLLLNGIQIVDCQVYTEHLESLGAKMIPRKKYLNYL
jgi:leucyl/phenylalanyl-tRNA---protein transferase